MSAALSAAAPELARIALDPARVEQDLARLAMTIVELVRRLLEAQAIRRFEAGSITAEEAERLGLGLLRTREAVGTLCERLGLRREELNLDLGPLGPLL
ncbi:gas vesicle protein K [Paracraurococcus ruber]|uniref:Gas vesicle protein n=1 Tax=Paracraurococcus ruber TaxID=77675 RepID=A0ABS1D808_9PROT|nr:gas vesicle protein K [Paracraurococcus ruber]MBK1662701.1 gas vesicle protein [Paracraurococcus ruber]TDG12222.1 gas vesicle protein K [Paracraurococcus ruber]